MIVNNGKYRNTVFILRRLVNGKEKFDGGFPVVESILDAFGEVPSISLADFKLLEQQEYLNRLNNFYVYLEIKYAFFKKANYPDTSHGDDLVMCPIDYEMGNIFYIDFDLVLYEVGTDREAELFMVVRDFYGTEVGLPGGGTVDYILKEKAESGYIDWDQVTGQALQATFLDGQSRVQVLSRFRYNGVDAIDIEFKNIHARIIEVGRENMAIGQNNTVFTESTEPFFLANIISNLYESYQDLPTVESLENAINSGTNFANPNDIVFTFSANVKTRPVLIYPATFFELSSILYIQQNLELLGAGAFVKSTMELNYNGTLTMFHVYSAANLIIYPEQVDYKFTI